MGMGFKNPVDLQAVFGHKSQHPVCRRGVAVARLQSVVEHGINYRSMADGGVPDYLRDGRGGGIKKCLDGSF